MNRINRKIIRLMKSNWLVKLVSVVIATLLWFYLNYEKLPVKYFSVPVKLINIPRAMAIAEDYNSIITVKVKAPKDILQSIYARYFKAQVDLSHAVIGKNRLPVEIEMTKKFRRARIVSMDPEEIKIILDQYVLKQLPVSVTIINSPAEGYVRTSETFSPKNIVVGGPKSLIDKMEVVRTAPIDIDGVTGSIYKEVELDLPTDLVKTRYYKRAYVNIKIKKNYRVRYIRNVKIVPKNLNERFQIINKDDIFANVRIEGPPERLVKLEKSKDFLFVDLSDISEVNVYMQKVRYKIPWNCKVYRIDPSEVRLEIEEK